jgi:hypothetical protein
MKPFISFLLLIFLTLPKLVSADTVQLKGVMIFPPLVPFGRDWKASLDCLATERGIRMNHSTEMEQQLRAVLQEMRRVSKDNNHYGLNVYLTEFSCAHDGLDSDTVFPLNIFNITDNSSAVVAHATIELYNESTGELLDSAAIQIKGIITEWHGFFLPIQTAYYYQDVTEDAVWQDLLKEIVKTVENRILGSSEGGE